MTDLLKVGILLSATDAATAPIKRLGATLSDITKGPARAIGQLSALTQTLTAKQASLGAAIGKGIGTTAPAALGAMQRDYTRIGRLIEEARLKQDRLTAAIARTEALSHQRSALIGQGLGTITVGGILAAPLVAATKQAISFESAMAEVRKVVDFAAPDGLQKMSKAITNLSLKIPKSREELAAIAASGGQLGVAEKDITRFVETVAKMSVAFDMTAESAGDSMAKISNVFHIPITGLEGIGNAINELSNASPAKAADIINVLQRIGGQANFLGMSAQAASALANAFVALGKPPEVAATAINAMFSKLGTATQQNKKFQAGLVDLGLSAKNLQRQMQIDPQGTIVMVMEKINKLGKERGLVTLGKLFGLEYSDDIATFAQGIDQYTKSIEILKSQKVEGSMGREFAARIQTTAGALQILTNNITAVAGVIGSVFLPAINRIIEAVKPAIVSFGQWADKNKSLVLRVTEIVGGLLAFKLATVGVRLALNLLLTPFAQLGVAIAWLSARWTLLKAVASPAILAAFTRIGTALRAIGTAFMFVGRAALAFFLTPMGLVVAAAAAVAVGAYLIYRNWDRLGPMFARLWARISAGAQQVGEAIKSGFQAALAWLQSLPARMMALGTQIIQGLINGIKSRAAAVGEAIKGAASAAVSGVKGTLGIQSPSRVMVGLGGNIMAGLRQGILAGSAGVMAAFTPIQQAIAHPPMQQAMASPLPAPASAQAAPAGGGGISITINLNGPASKEAAADIGETVRREVLNALKAQGAQSELARRGRLFE